MKEERVSLLVYLEEKLNETDEFWLHACSPGVAKEVLSGTRGLS